MKHPSSLNYLIPIIMLCLGIVMGMNRFEPNFEVTEIIYISVPGDTLHMLPSACIDMFSIHDNIKLIGELP